MFGRKLWKWWTRREVSYLISINKLICQKFKTLDNIIDAPYEEIASINGIGEAIALAIREYFDNFDNLMLINELKLLGLNTNFIESTVKESYFSNKKNNKRNGN